jgi:PhnB protein
MQLDPYLFFDGNCEEALKFYEECFHGKVEAKFPYEGSPAAQGMPAEWGKKIMHSRLVFGDNVILASDAAPGRHERPQGFSMCIGLKDVSEGERVFKALAEGGKVQMPFEKTFWSKGFGMLVDRFGIPWMVNCE